MNPTGKVYEPLSYSDIRQKLREHGELTVKVQALEAEAQKLREALERIRNNAIGRFWNSEEQSSTDAFQAIWHQCDAALAQTAAQKEKQ